MMEVKGKINNKIKIFTIMKKNYKEPKMKPLNLGGETILAGSDEAKPSNNMTEGYSIKEYDVDQ